MDFRFFLFLSSIIIIAFQIDFPSKAEASRPVSTHKNKLLTEVCKQSGDFKFCMELLNSKPRISSSKNITTVANYALALAKKESAVTRNFFKKMERLRKISVFNECANYFNGTIMMLNLGGLDGGTASLDVHYALDNCQYCENALNSSKIHTESISSQIFKWKKYFNVAYSTVVIIENETPSQP